MKRIAIAGTGYVGLSNAVLLAQHNEVVCLDRGAIPTDRAAPALERQAPSRSSAALAP